MATATFCSPGAAKTSRQSRAPHNIRLFSPKDHLSRAINERLLGPAIPCKGVPALLVGGKEES
jgi:hypothetical protein